MNFLEEIEDLAYYWLESLSLDNTIQFIHSLTHFDSDYKYIAIPVTDFSSFLNDHGIVWLYDCLVLNLFS